MRLIAKDKRGDVVSFLNPANIQWTRKYYGFGRFSVQIAAADYSPLMYCIDTPDRPERGLINRVELTGGQGGSFVQLSGFFSEKLLDNFVIHPVLKATGEISSLAAMLVLEHCSDIGTRATSFKEKVSIDDLGSGIGTKLFEILEPLELSYRVEKNVFTLWRGLDRTAAQGVNNRATFSSAWGNVKNLSLCLDDSNYKNKGIIAGVNDLGEYVFEECGSVLQGDDTREVFIDATSVDGTYISTGELRAELKQYGTQRLVEEYKKIDEISFDLHPDSYLRYRQDFDLGDKVDVSVPELGRIYSVRITEINEVWKGNVMNLEITAGNKQRVKYKVFR